MERPTDDYKRTHNLVLKSRDTTFGGQVSRLQVAELVAACCRSPAAAENKVVEVVAETTAPLRTFEELLVELPQDISRVSGCAGEGGAYDSETTKVRRDGDGGVGGLHGSPAFLSRLRFQGAGESFWSWNVGGLERLLGLCRDACCGLRCGLGLEAGFRGSGLHVVSVSLLCLDVG